MVIYADILILFNFAVDFLNLSLTAKITDIKLKTLRLILASLFASFSSLLIFLPKFNWVLQILLNAVISALIIFIAFSFKNIRVFIRETFTYILIMFLLNGIAFALSKYISNGYIISKNGVIYCDISAVQLLLLTLIFYILIIAFRKIFVKKNSKASRCNLVIVNNNKKTETVALVDSGNGLKDIYNERQVIIVDRSIGKSVFKNENNFLLLPYKTISGGGLIEGKYCENVFVNGKELGKCFVAISKDKFDDDYRAIVGNDICNAEV